TVPALVIALIVFAIVDFRYSSRGAGIEEVQMLQSQLSEIYTITPWLLIVPMFIIVMMIFIIPALPGLTIGSILGAMCSVVVQNVRVGEAINILYYGFSIDTGNEVVDNLLNNGGIESVMFTISLIIIAMCFGGILEFTNIFEVLVEQ